METQIISLATNEINATNVKNAPEAVLSGGMLQTGEEVGGFRVDRLLSTSGGEAEVYLCTKGGENYVLKYYYTKKPNSEVEEKIKSFTHKNIISILDYGEYKDRFFAVLEYAAGGALDDKLPNGNFKYLPLSENDAKQAVLETLDAFEACHNLGIIHRDIKPGNLFYKNQEILPDGKYKGSRLMVGDFGIASVFEVDAGMSKHMTETGAKTEGYAAPEAYTGVIGKEYDYYSLGVTLWALLTGLEPFVNEKGQAMYSGQITLDTIQGKTVDNLLSRSPKMSASMQKLIRGLLTVRHDKRWSLDEVKRHLAGENIELFKEERTLPNVEIGGESCSTYKDIALALINHPEEGKKFVFKRELSKYLIKIDQKLVDRLDELIENYSAENREDEGLVFIAYSLCPNMPFPLEHGLSISSLQEMSTVLNTDPDAILPFLRDEKKGFYAYLEVSGLGEHGKKVKEIVNSTAGDIRAVSRIIATFQGNEINPFQDGINNGYRMASLEDMYNLPDYLKERVMIFIERNYGLLPSWIENLTGKNIDSWFAALSEQKKKVARWGAWDFFILFMQGLDSYDKIQKNGNYVLYEKGGKKGLYQISLNANHAEMLYGVETGANKLTLKKNNGDAVFNGTYAVNFATGYDGDGASNLQFIDTENRMTVFDGSMICYFNINSSLKEPRYELKEGEIKLLVALGDTVPCLDLARSLGERNNYNDMNKLIEAFWKKFGEEKKFRTERDILLLINKDKMEGLSHSFDFYLNEIGVTYYMENSSREALRYFNETMAINPQGIGSNGQSYNYNYGLALCSEETPDNWNKAISYLDNALSVTPDKPQSLVLKGTCLFKLNKYNDAIACFNMALDKKYGVLSNFEKRDVFATRAKCYNALGMKDKADKDNAEADRLSKLPDVVAQTAAAAAAAAAAARAAASAPVPPPVPASAPTSTAALAAAFASTPTASLLSSSTTKTCPLCGTKLEPGEEFCKKCKAMI